MQVIYQNTSVPLQSCAVTVGFFDGVHRGHKYLLDELKTLARLKGLQSMVVTFASHPRKVLDSGYMPDLLTSLSEKISLIERCGIDYCMVLSFTEQMAMLSASEFMAEYLLKICHAKTLLVGHDHRFGHNRNDAFAEYRAYGSALGMDVFQASIFSDPINHIISSSRIRNVLRQGDVELANTMLGHDFNIKGNVVSGFKVGRKIGFPTANIQPDDPDKLIPGLGVYAVEAKYTDVVYHGMMNVGVRPTLSKEQKVSIEVNLFDFDQDIYHQVLEVRLRYRIRDEVGFKTIDELISRLKADKKMAIELLNRK